MLPTSHWINPMHGYVDDPIMYFCRLARTVQPRIDRQADCNRREARYQTQHNIYVVTYSIKLFDIEDYLIGLISKMSSRLFSIVKCSWAPKISNIINFSNYIDLTDLTHSTLIILN